MLWLLDRHEKPWHADLARTVRRLIEAETAPEATAAAGLRLVADSFYRGPIAREIDAWSPRNGGLIRYADLATHVTRIEEPVAVDTAATRSTSAARGPRGRTCWRPCSSSKGST